MSAGASEGSSPYEPPHYAPPGAPPPRQDRTEPDLLRRIDELIEPVHATEEPAAPAAESPGGIVPSFDIWDDDGTTVDDGPDLDPDDSWLRDAQVVMHDLDGEPIEEPLDDPVFDGREDEAAASRMARWGRESMLGASLVGVGRGIQKVLEPRDPIEIVTQIDRDQLDPDEPVSLLLVEGHPERSVAIVRPWLLGGPRRRRRRRGPSADPQNPTPEP